MMRSSLSASLRALACVLPVFLSSPALGDDPPPAARPNVLLITVDTLRPDALGWVAGKNSTPALDALAASGVSFPAALASVPITLPSHTSLMTALVPRRHGVRDNGQVLGPSPGTLAETLGTSGFTTAAFVSGYPLAAEFGLDRGFEHYDDTFRSARGALERRAGDTTAAALDWLRDAAQPWFLWVHYYDPHDPYDPPEEHRRSGGRGAYYGEVAAVDSAVGALLQGAEKGATTQPGGSLITVFAADHGESLGEHGENTHGFFVYDSTLRVPLVIAWPGHLEPRRVDAPGRLVDIVPTLLDLLSLDPPEGIDGVSLTPLLKGRDQEIPPALLESRRPWNSYGWAPLTALSHDGWKLIVAPKPELYDLTTDPGETKNLIDTDRRRARELQAMLREAKSLPEAASRGAVDPETSARLRALGYVGAGASKRDQPPANLPDPKDRIEVWNLLGEAEGAFARGDFEAALRGYGTVLAQEPGNPYALARSGMAFLEIGDAENAASRLVKAVTRQPDQPEVRNSLAVALTRLRRFEEAEEQWAELIRLQPRRAGAWAGLGNTLGLAKKSKAAVEALERAVELAPDNPEHRVRLGFAAFAVGRLEQAANSLEQAAELVGPENFPHRASLGILLLRQGNLPRARLWLSRSQPTEPDFAAGRIELARLEVAAGNREAARRALVEALQAAPRLLDNVRQDQMLAPLLR